MGLTVYDNTKYWSELHAADPGQLSAVGHPRLGEGFNRRTYAMRIAAAERVLRRAGVHRTTSVLEGAVGTGIYGRLWERLGAVRWTGVDISAGAVRSLCSRHPSHRFIVADLASDALQDSLGTELYDLVAAIDVLFHLTDEAIFARALRGLGERVAPGGRLILSGVFSGEATNQAAHVRHRGMDVYDTILASGGLTRVAREQVFAILDDPVCSSRTSLTARAAKLTWRSLAATLRCTPNWARPTTGTAFAGLLGPVDRLLGRSACFREINLEFAVYARTAAETQCLISTQPAARPTQPTRRSTSAF